MNNSKNYFAIIKYNWSNADLDDLNNDLIQYCKWQSGFENKTIKKLESLKVNDEIALVKRKDNIDNSKTEVFKRGKIKSVLKNCNEFIISWDKEFMPFETTGFSSEIITKLDNDEVIERIFGK